MKKKILVLGASSFGGSSLLKFLKKNTKYKIWGTYKTKNNINKLFRNDKYQYNFIRLDLSSSNNRLIEIIEKLKPNYIFDFASVCLVNESWSNPDYYFKVNFSSKLKLVKNL